MEDEEVEDGGGGGEGGGGGGVKYNWGWGGRGETGFPIQRNWTNFNEEGSRDQGIISTTIGFPIKLTFDFIYTNNFMKKKII